MVPVRRVRLGLALHRVDPGVLGEDRLHPHADVVRVRRAGEDLVEVPGVGGTFLGPAQEDESGALGARIGAQDLGPLRGVDQ